MRFPEHSPRSQLSRVISWIEQEIRAHPRLHRSFYRVIARNAHVRHLAGRAKARIRNADARNAPPPEAPDSDIVSARRRQAVAVRLGLDLHDWADCP